MRFAWVVLLASAAFGQEEVKNPHTSPSDVAAGAKIFRSHCAECHGFAGEGGRAPKLTTGVFFHGGTDADLFRNITDGIPGTAMPSVFFSQDQVWQIVAYVRSLSTGNARPPLGDAQRGAQLFHQQKCTGCHLARGEGGVRGPDLSMIGSQRSLEYLRQAILEPGAKVLREYWVARITTENGSKYAGFVLNEDTHYVQLLDFSHGLETLPKREFREFHIEKSSVMPSYGGILSAKDADDLVAYLWSLQRRKGDER
ncbi:MAG: c-type cytochrome [Bryobacterales bacterium]|nr:c-type cytochrome [Bryobacterales bacterium]